MSAPTDNLVRSAFFERAATVKEGEKGRTLVGYFSTFSDWYEIDSWYEGRFLEQVAPGAYARTLVENADRIKALYDHGYDPQLGNKPLGPWRAQEDDNGAWYEIDLIDTDYNRGFVIPAAEAGLLGSSFRFRVVGESWNEPKTATEHNPLKLPERTITDVDVFEFGPVTFPANPAVGSVGLRSGTDAWIDRLLHDPKFVARFTERVGLRNVETLLASLPADGHTETTNQPTPVESQPTAAAPVRTKNQRLSLAASAHLPKE